jgi:hypothetical protein
MWVRQGRTDAWIAHKIDVSIEQLERFKKDHDLDGEGAAPGRPADPLSVPPPEPESYMAPEDDDEDEPDEPEVLEVRPPRPRPRRGRTRDQQPAGGRDRERDDKREDERGSERGSERDSERGSERASVREDGRDGERDGERDDDTPARSRRRRGRRGGRRRRRPSSFEATFDHGEEGYGLWLDPAVVENPVYSEHWAGHRAVVVTFDRDAITIRRAESDGAEHDEPGPEPGMEDEDQ